MLGSLESPVFLRAATDQEHSSRSCPTLQLQPHPGGPAQTSSSQLAVPHLQRAHNLAAVQGNRWMLLRKVKHDTAERQPLRKSHRGTQGYLCGPGEAERPHHSPCSPCALPGRDRNARSPAGHTRLIRGGRTELLPPSWPPKPALTQPPWSCVLKTAVAKAFLRVLLLNPFSRTILKRGSDPRLFSVKYRAAKLQIFRDSFWNSSTLYKAIKYSLARGLGAGLLDEHPHPKPQSPFHSHPLNI